ncbi:MAG: 1-acyl-sn-glycerol-3-phosphate acyltransferase [Porphyromonadaceae bacterium]|nr:1-acyl-sn-glycerol-3-phosphate acyltransferase [Porphyromonadaceae bacterium]
MSEDKLLRIDLEDVVRKKSARIAKRIPKFIFNYLERTIQQERFNRFFEVYPNLRGVDFANTVIEYLNISLQVEGEENIPAKGRFIFASNHPLGGIDGVALISVLGQRYNKNIKFVVNDLLTVLPLSDVFLPINKYGKQDKDKANNICEAYESDCQIIVFPAGLCSRQQKREICDLTWNKAFIAKSVQYQRDVIPIWFEGYNSPFFYRFARWRKRLGIKFNVELVYLPDEMFKSERKRFTIHFGRPIPWQTFDKSKSRMEWAQYVKGKVYSIRDSLNNSKRL